mmetsp:Transcript_55278/g.124100  ORF Transcript_55278/g.124100 Transcript_55278/m.124100 type:complete len:441 (-) Transcript_55278:150-1472(-)
MAAAMSPSLPIQGRGGRPLLPGGSVGAKEPNESAGGTPVSQQMWPSWGEGPPMDRTPSYHEPIGGMFGAGYPPAPNPISWMQSAAAPQLTRHHPSAGSVDQKQPAKIEFRQNLSMNPISEHSQALHCGDDDLQAYVDPNDLHRGTVLAEPNFKVKNTFIDGLVDDEDAEDSGLVMGRAKTDGISIGRGYRPGLQPGSCELLMEGMLGPPALGQHFYQPPFYPDAQLLQQMSQNAAYAGRWPPDMQALDAAGSLGDYGQGAARYSSASSANRPGPIGLVPPQQEAPPVAISDVPPPPVHAAPHMLHDTAGLSMPPLAPLSIPSHGVGAGLPYQAPGFPPLLPDVQQAPEALQEPPMNVVITPIDRRRPEGSIGAGLHDSGTCQPCAWFWKPQGCGNGQVCRHCHLCPEGELKNRKKAKIATLRAGAAASNNARGNQSRRGR